MIYRHIYKDMTGENIAVYSFLTYADMPSKIDKDGVCMQKADVDSQEIVAIAWHMHDISLAHVIEKYSGLERERLSLLSQASMITRIKSEYENVINMITGEEPTVCVVGDKYILVDFNPQRDLILKNIKKL